MKFIFSFFIFFIINEALQAQEITKGENGEIIITTHCTKRSALVSDTLTYLKRFETNKANYINKPLSVLLNDMTQIQPKTAWPVSHGRKKTVTPGTRFKFCEMDFSFHNAITLLITWQDPIPRDQTKYYEQKNYFYFTDEERVFYGSKIVKDIIVYR